SDQTAIEVTLPTTDRVTTSGPPGSGVSPSNSTALSFSAQKVPSDVPTYTTKSRYDGFVLLPKFTATGPAVISAEVVKAAVESWPDHPLVPPAAGFIARSLLPDATYRRSACGSVARGITRIATREWIGSPAPKRKVDVSACQ